MADSAVVVVLLCDLILCKTVSLNFIQSSSTDLLLGELKSGLFVKEIISCFIESQSAL